ncbi:amidohydrolase family protein [Portibacter marinus]|uniref:amidohydrolase family protein n=1 Tax=Portibacter marinus TaxID=2898660 RepID=UPI001F43D3E5|nr:amidohydrolase family protein [Portibacter marinus]
MIRAVLFIFLILPFSVWAQEPETLVLENARYLDLNSGTFKNGHLFIRYGIIQNISENKFVHDNAIVIDASEYYIIPGLFDSHIHLFQSGAIYTRPDAIDLTAFKPYEKERSFLRENAGDLLKRYLRLGITSVIDIGGPMANYSIREEFKDDPDYPNLFLTGPLVSTYQPPAYDIEDSPIIKVNNEEEARELVRRQIPYEPDFIKVWGIALPGISSEELLGIMKATVDESRKNDFKVFMHATQLNTAKLAVKAGADVLVHSAADAEGMIDEEFVQMIVDSNVVYIPTLVVGPNYSRTLSGHFKPTKTDFEVSNPFILGEIFDSEHLPAQDKFQRWKDNYPMVLERQEYIDSTTKVNFNLLTKYHTTIATGTDAGNIGTLHASSYYDEIDAMQEAGLSNLQMLRSSTINGAIAVGKEETLGSIQIGKVADLVLLNSNPLENLENLKDIEMVVKSGKVHQASQILEVTPAILAQQQLNAYNAGDIDAFLEPYSNDIEIYNFPDDLRTKGKEEMREGYASFFKNNPDLHCELVNRIVNGNTVIDHERITGVQGSGPFTAIAIYKIEEDKIAKVYFVR